MPWPKLTGLESSGEELSQPHRPIGEYPFDVAPDEQPVHESPTAGSVTDLVRALRSSVHFRKRVRVVPECVRTAQLNIDKSVWRIPFGYLGSPANGNAVNPDPIVNACARAHRDRLWGENFETHPGRGDGFKIGRVGKKLEHLSPGTWQPKLGIEGEEVQRCFPVVAAWGICANHAS